jgi:selenophosphate synthetase-related protein
MTPTTPKTVKNGIINTMLYRAETHYSTSTAYNQEIDRVKEILVNNKYPSPLIQNIINKKKIEIKKKKRR